MNTLKNLIKTDPFIFIYGLSFFVLALIEWIKFHVSAVFILPITYCGMVIPGVLMRPYRYNIRKDRMNRLQLLHTRQMEEYHLSTAKTLDLEATLAYYRGFKWITIVFVFNSFTDTLTSPMMRLIVVVVAVLLCWFKIVIIRRDRDHHFHMARLIQSEDRSMREMFGGLQ